MKSKLSDAAACALSTVRPRVERSLVAVLRADRLLLWGFLLLWVAALIPLFFTPFLPFSDMANNVSMSSLVWETARHHGVAATYYRVNWLPNPYWTSYAVMALVSGVAGPLMAAKAITAIVLLLLPLGTMRLLVTLRRSPRMALCAFLLGYNHVVYAGWVSLMIGLGLSFFIIAWTIEAQTVKEACRVALYSALLGITHIQAIWLLMIALPLLVPFGRPFFRRALVHTIALGGTALTVLPWLLIRMGPKVTSAATAFSFEWHSPEYKLNHFFGYTMDNFVRPDAVRITAIAFVLLVLGPLFLGLLPRESTRERTAMPLVLVAAAGILYVLLPFSISGPVDHWYTYPRFATVTLYFLLLVPAPRLDGRWVGFLLPAVLVTLVIDLKTVEQFRSYGERTRPLLEIIAHVKPHAAILPLVFDDADADPDLKLPPYHQLEAYVTAFRKGYEGYFWDIPSWPLGYRHENKKPYPYWDIGAQMAFTMDKYGKYFDYVLVQGFQHGDPVLAQQGGPLPRPQLIDQAGRWRLYEIQR
jgi:hypothetical protein